MKTFLQIIFLTCLSALCSCSFIEEEKPYQVYWEENNLCVILSRPSVGIAGPNKVDWGGVEMSDVSDDIYRSIIRSDVTGNIFIWVRFKRTETDKYGNQTYDYDDFPIVTIPMDEAKKYRHGYYLDQNYHITSKIAETALSSVNIISFNSDGTITYKEGIKPEDFGNPTISSASQQSQRTDSIYIDSKTGKPIKKPQNPDSTIYGITYEQYQIRLRNEENIRKRAESLRN